MGITKCKTVTGIARTGIRLAIEFRLVAVAICMSMLLGCFDSNYRNVTISGFVKDDAREAVRDASVNLKVWVYNTSIFESEIEEKTVFTDNKGFFESTFEKAEAVDIVVYSENFKSKEFSYTLKRNKLDLELILDLQQLSEN